MTTTYEPRLGETIEETCVHLERLANVDSEVRAEFSGVTIVAKKGMAAGDLHQTWIAEMDANAEAYRNSPEGIESAKREFTRKAGLMTYFMSYVCTVKTPQGPRQLFGCCTTAGPMHPILKIQEWNERYVTERVHVLLSYREIDTEEIKDLIECGMDPQQNYPDLDVETKMIGGN